MADLKITELVALTVVSGEDLIAIVDDPTGTASTKKARIDDVQSDWHVGARVYNSGNLSINDQTTTVLTFDSERYDTDAIHDPGSNPSRLTCKTAGKYFIAAHVRFAADADGVRIVHIYLNGTTIIANTHAEATPAGSSSDSIATVYELAVDDYVEARVYHDAGNALNVEASGNYSPEFAMHRIG